MGRTHQLQRWVGLALVVTGRLAVASCSSSGDTNSGAKAATTTPRAVHRAGADRDRPPPAKGDINSAATGRTASEGLRRRGVLHRRHRHQLRGRRHARSGEWAASAGRRGAVPHPRGRAAAGSAPTDFSGTVLVEWFNVSALESSPDWAFMSEEIGRAGSRVHRRRARRPRASRAATRSSRSRSIPSRRRQSASTPDKSGLKNIDPDALRHARPPGRRVRVRHLQPGRREPSARADSSCSVIWSRSR